MDARDIKSMFDGIDDATKKIIAGTLKEDLGTALKAVNATLQANGKNKSNLSPRPDLVMNAFRLTPWDGVRVVILGQDPFVKLNEATGLCFSVPKGIKTPPSTENIYKCLIQSGLMQATPEHGDLSSWATQGVLMLNTALTTVYGQSNAHRACWQKYTDGIISALAACGRPLVFILLGNQAQEKTPLITGYHHILTWGHPSPTSNYNKTDNPKNFVHADVFTRTNAILAGCGSTPINWDPDSQAQMEIPADAALIRPQFNAPPVDLRQELAEPRMIHPCIGTDPMYDASADEPNPLDPNKSTLWVFTDGGARANGKPECVASWGFYITDNVHKYYDYGLVPLIIIPDKKYQTSNNRGELMAILKAFQYIVQLMGEPHSFTYEQIAVISDSEYSIKGIDVRGLEGKANQDLLIPAKDILKQLRGRMTVNMQHVEGHGEEPADRTSRAWFLWRGNAIVDAACQIPLDTRT